MKRIFLATVSIILFGLMCSCYMFNDQYRMAQFFVADVKEKEPEYRVKAEEFVGLAQARDSKRMVKISSPTTVKNNGGADILESKFKEKIIPKFINTEVKWKGKGNICYDEEYNVGLAFKGDAIGENNTYKFAVSVFEENKQLVIVFMRER